MTRAQLVILYAAVIFMMVWGFDLINIIKYGQDIKTGDIFNLFILSQVIYTTVFLLLCRYVFFTLYTKRKYGWLALAVILLIPAFVVLRYIIEEVTYPLLFNTGNYPRSVKLLFYFLDNVYYALVYLTLGFLLFLLEYQVATQKKQALLLAQNREAELQFLRSQVNPHFLFNTLNNIYSLTYEKSDKAPDAMLRLAELMRYMLYEKKELVALEKEWQYVNSYIGLQQLRFHYPLPLQVEASGNLSQTSIPPFLLIPFVENAFKHGDFRNAGSPLYLRLVINNGLLDFEIRNTISHRQKDECGGIGLDNTRRRLALLYPGRHTLYTAVEQDLFVARLSLKL